MQRRLRESGVTVACELRLVAFPQRLMAVHTRSVIAVQRLRHERRRLAVLRRGVLYDVLENLQTVGRAQHVRKTKIDFALTGGRNFVVVTFDGDSAIGERK